MPGTPATLASYCDPASPAAPYSNLSQTRSNSLGAAKMDLEASGGSSNDSDDHSHNETKYMPKM